LAGAASPSPFSVTAIAVNPGQAGSFPWLSSIAGRFESYLFQKLKYCYETEAPSSLGGTLVLSLDYDASDPTPASKQQALAYRNAVRSAPWTTCCHSSDLEDLRKQKTYFVRPAGLPANTDIKEYDTGNLFAITQGVTTSGAVLGELYVEYDVLLMTPVLEAISRSGFAAAQSSSATGVFSVPVDVGGSITVTPGPAGLMSINGLVIGSEYQITLANITATSLAQLGTPVGLTPRSTFTNATASTASQTYVATALSGSVNASFSAAANDVLISVHLLNPPPLF